MDGFVAAAKAVLCTVWQVLNTNFSAALFGALFGAVGAHLIADYAQRRRQSIEELRSANAATLLAFTIFSICASLKKQHVRDLTEAFIKKRAEVEAHLKRVEEGLVERGQEIHVETDFKNLTPPSVPMEPVKQLVFEKLSATRRPIVLAAMLSQTLDALASAIHQRNELILENMHTPMPQHVRVFRYFGLPMNGGHIDARYRDTVDAIALYLDDCIFFAYLLCLDMERHAKQLAASLGRKAPKVDGIDFKQARDNALIPDEKHYKDWVDMGKEPARAAQ